MDAPEYYRYSRKIGKEWFPKKAPGKGVRFYHPIDVLASGVLEQAVKQWNALFFPEGNGLVSSNADLEKAECVARERGFDSLGEELIYFFSPGNSYLTGLVFMVCENEKYEFVQGSGKRAVRRVGHDEIDIREFIQYETGKGRYRDENGNKYMNYYDRWWEDFT